MYNSTLDIHSKSLAGTGRNPHGIRTNVGNSRSYNLDTFGTCRNLTYRKTYAAAACDFDTVTIFATRHDPIQGYANAV